ncbi:ABC transporter substrate-binding protein [Paenibacillus alginolyticus]|uniref:ABC transporter substrate-binding protein n=1 Tax=Paenibacillus alginolyticus TaxID=59839 RepID=A0ABT4GH35_9BACL|nr:ABC transporter substrate-binding protein [Paenibacillus alginolyticus]MCY9695466.1 ABC transporter substrate-binding protein [Paenibacillus alginolyticus]MEC0146327.1 ABC transporter substrate-binding protein [Paenibacillus alginolyticus]
MHNRRIINRSKLPLVMLLVCLLAVGCSSTKTTKSNESAGQTKQKPDTLTTVKVSTVSNTIDFIPWYVAQSKGIFEKYNLKVEFVSVDGGVVALRGLQTGDFQFIASLPESIVTAVSGGANIKIIGSLSSKTLFSVFVSPEINKPEDLKGKAAGILQPGNGVDILMRWWLKKHGLEPDKDVRIVSSGATPARLAALKNGQVQVTLLQPPNDLNGEKAGMKRLANLSDELKDYNQDVIATNGNVLKKPEVARAFMAATAEAIQFVKDPANYKEVVEIGMKSIGTDEEITTKSFIYTAKAIPDKGKLNIEGIKWAIDAVKEVSGINEELPLNKLVDENFYAK